MKGLKIFAFCVAFAQTSHAKDGDDAMHVAVQASYPPFAQNSDTGRGMLVDIVDAALAQSPDIVDAVDFFQSSGGSFQRVLASPETDIIVGLEQPDCSLNVAGFDPCRAAYLSDPVLQTVVSLFTHVDRQFDFKSAQDLVGKTVCIAASAEAPRPLWQSELLSDTLVLRSLEDCFDALMSGRSDAVAANEFYGVGTMFKLDLTDQVVPLPEPLARPTLHVAISKAHWRATAHLFRFNAGLARIKQSGAYGEIVAQHVQSFWDDVSP